MSDVTFTKLQLKKPLIDTKKITFNNIDIEVKQYLPMKDKYDLIEITLQKSLEPDKKIYNSFFYYMYFHLNIVYLYTNISFTEKQKEDEFKLFDILSTSGLLGSIIEAIPEVEYEKIQTISEDIINERVKYNESIGGAISSIITDLPKNAEAAKDIVESFNPEKFGEVINFAKAVNNDKLKV